MKKDNENQAPLGKIIPFERSGEFFLKRGLRHMEHNDVLEAMANYRQALRREPNNTDCQLAVAEILTAMNHYEASNRLLLPMLTLEDTPTECYFGMACNFLGLQDLDHACDSLKSYLTLDPEGEFALDALDILDALQDEDAFRTMEGLQTKEELEAIQICNKSKMLVELDASNDAIALLEESIAQYPNIPFLQSNLAMAYFCAHQDQKAREAIDEVLKKDPNNIQANCNLALIVKSENKPEELKPLLDRIASFRTEQLDDLNRIVVVLLELEEYETALKEAKRLYHMLPYDIGAIHKLGTCYYKLGQYQQAMRYYDRLLKMDSEDTVARYYRTCCKQALQQEHPRSTSWMNGYQVPYDEMLHRLNRINAWAQQPAEERKRLWQEDPDCRALLLWGLSLNDMKVKRGILSLISTLGNQEAERILRQFQLLQNQPDILKYEVFELLKRMGAQEPYLAYINGKLVQNKVSIAKLSAKQLPATYRKLLYILFEHMGAQRNEQCIMEALMICEQYLSGISEYKRMGPLQIQAMAAALDYLACKKCGESVTEEELYAMYNVSKTRFNNALSKVMKVLENVNQKEPS